MKMRYEYRRGIQKPKRWWVTLPVVAVIVGAYATLSALAPSMPIYASAPDETARKLTETKPALNENRLYIPKINLNIATTSESGNASVPAGGAVQRSIESGNPKDGGNYVLAAHRFQLGYTPQTKCMLTMTAFDTRSRSRNESLWIQPHLKQRQRPTKTDSPCFQLNSPALVQRVKSLLPNRSEPLFGSTARQN